MMQSTQFTQQKTAQATYGLNQYWDIQNGKTFNRRHPRINYTRHLLCRRVFNLSTVKGANKMKRTDVYDGNGNWTGWFDADKATEIADYSEGEPYKHGKVLISTASKKLVVNEWTNSGMDVYRLATGNAEIAEILSKHCLDGTYETKLQKILDEYEL